MVGSGNAYTLAYDDSKDTADKSALETAFKNMVSTPGKAATGSWDTDFEQGTNGTYVYTISATGYHDVVFTITVSGNATVTTSTITGVAASLVGSGNAYTLAYDDSKDTATKVNIKTALVAMVSTGTETPNGSWEGTPFNKDANGTYVLKVSATGYHDVVFTITVSGNATVTTSTITGVAASLVGSGNAYTLAYNASNDTADKSALETAFKNMVSTPGKAATGSWDTDFEQGTNGTYVYTISATGYHDVVFTITVSGN